MKLQVSVFLFSLQFVFVHFLSNKDGAMYLPFLLLIAVIYDRVTLPFCPVETNDFAVGAELQVGERGTLVRLCA